MFVVEGIYNTNEKLQNALSILLEWWAETDYTEPDESCSIWKEPIYTEYGIWKDSRPIVYDICHEPIYSDYEIWPDPNGYTDTTSEIFQCNFDQMTAKNDSQIVSQEYAIDEFFIIKKDAVNLEDLHYYSSRDDITEPELVDQFNSSSRNNEEKAVEENKVVEEDSELIVNFNNWINFDSIDHKGFFNSCKLIKKLTTEI